MEQTICHSASVINLAFMLVFASPVAVAELNGVATDVVGAGMTDDASNAAAALLGTLVDSGHETASEINRHGI